LRVIHGIDISSHQSTFDTKGLSFVFVKATEGHTYVSPRQSEQAKLARDAGCVVGFYHFLWPGNIRTQAAYFVEKCASHTGDLLAVDWEWTSEHTAASSAEKDGFLHEVKRLRPHHRVLLYCNRDFWLHRDTSSYAGDGLWIADDTTAGKPRIKAKWRIHQYASTPLDKDVADFGSTASLRDWATGLQ
jgi:GH25 family lysozyme M1 (1,4-beta-N-acetylmuramidase)